ncbi:hypothetical protein OROMI_006234 [Orobanche minor]
MKCVVLEPPPVEHPLVGRPLVGCSSAKRPSVDHPQEEEDGEKSLIPRKKKKEEVPPARATAGALTLEVPIAATPLSERQPRPSDDFHRECAIMDAETPRGKPFFVCDPTKVLHDSPGCPLMVVDFLDSRSPRASVDVPSCINRAIASLSQAWTTDLNEVAARRGNDATQALFAQALL